MSALNGAEALYLDLMKRCLIDSIYLDDPLANYMLYREHESTRAWKRHAIRVLQSFLERYRLRLVEPHWVSWLPEYGTLDPAEKRKMRQRGLGWPSRAHTMISRDRLDNIQQCVETVLRDGIPGDLIETGVWRGGACIFMRAILKAYGDITRRVWLADSFAGLPPPDEAAYPADAGDRHHLWSELAVSRAEVEENFRATGCSTSRSASSRAGSRTRCPTAPIEQLAVAAARRRPVRVDDGRPESALHRLLARRLRHRRRLLSTRLCEGDSRLPRRARHHRRDTEHRQSRRVLAPLGVASAAYIGLSTLRLRNGRKRTGSRRGPSNTCWPTGASFAGSAQ